jgi:FkbM family methyltransferase
MRALLRKTLRTGLTYLPSSFANLKPELQGSFYRLIRHPFEEDFKALKELLSPADVCLDIGANRGQSIDALHLVSKELRITAFEPQPDLQRLLRKRFRTNPHVTIMPFGLGDREAETEIFVPSYNGYRFDGLATLEREGADEWFHYSILGFDERKVAIDSFVCSTRTLDSFAMTEVAFVKIDVQGSEFAVLRGGVDTLRLCQPHLLIETPSPEIMEFLGGLGYKRYTYEDGRLGEPSGRWTLNSFFLA